MEEQGKAFIFEINNKIKDRSTFIKINQHEGINCCYNAIELFYAGPRLCYSSACRQSLGNDIFTNDSEHRYTGPCQSVGSVHC